MTDLRSGRPAHHMTAPAQELAIARLIDSHVPELIPTYNDKYPGRNLTLLGSFKAWERIKATRQQFQRLGCWVVAPQGNDITHYAGATGTFEVLDTDAKHIALFEERLGQRLTAQETAVFLEALFLRAIVASDACYVVGLQKPNIDDGEYMGTQVASEVGFALGSMKRVFGSPMSPSLDERDGFGSLWGPYSHLIQPATPEEVASILV